MRRLTNPQRGALRLGAALLMLSAVCLPTALGRSAGAADANPPPPREAPDALFGIPKPIRVAYATRVRPAYDDWRGIGADTVGVFSTFLLTQPIDEAHRFHFVRLYLADRGGG